MNLVIDEFLKRNSSIFEIIKGFEEVNIGIKMRGSKVRGQTHQIVRELCKDCSARNGFFPNRIPLLGIPYSRGGGDFSEQL